MKLAEEAAQTMQDDAYTFLGNSETGAPVFMDIAVFENDELARSHARGLLDEHNSADTVEVWRANKIIGRIPRSRSAGPFATEHVSHQDANARI